MFRPRTLTLLPLIVLILLSACQGAGGGSATVTATSAIPVTGALTASVTPATPAATGSPTSLPQTATPSETATPAEPAPGYFRDPVLRADFPDPFILKANDRFYAYATNGAGRNVQTAVSNDLVNWEILSDAMPALPAWAALTSGKVWAPEVIQVGNTFNLYYTAHDKASNRQCVGVAVSDKPEGKFKDTRDKPLVCQASEGGTIDPSPFRDGDQLYLLFKNDGNCCGGITYIYIQPMAPDGLSMLGQPNRLASDDQVWEGRVIEAPTLLKHAGIYYLFYSGNDYNSVNYAVGYAVCQTLTSPCQDAPENPILKSSLKKPPVIGPGHQAILQLGDQTWIVYHAWEVATQGTKTDRRLMWLDRLDWVDGKPVVRGPTTGDQPDPTIP
jgi:beta-xylosidase